MTSPMTISTILVEPESASTNELTDKEKFAKRFQPRNLKNSHQTNPKKRSALSSTTEQPLRADDIKEHRLWALASSIACCFLIAPIVALYQTRRIREMKANQELTRAKLWSDRVNNNLIFSNITGAIIWVALIFVIAVLLILGHFYP